MGRESRMKSHDCVHVSTKSTGIKEHKIVSHEVWLSARTALLAKEKEFTRLRDDLSQQRRELPWEVVSKDYVFDGPDGKRTLADLFEGRSQLVIYHAMFDPASAMLTIA